MPYADLREFIERLEKEEEIVRVKAQVDIRDCFGPTQLHAAARLMQKYNDIPMDFADATLVLLADETGMGDILTLDERGFRAYRFRGTRRFNLVLSRE